jgi:hypothetical protein
MTSSVTDDRPPLNFKWSPVGKQSKATILVYDGDQLIETETVDLAKPERRTQFAEKIAAATESSIEDVESHLLRIAHERSKEDKPTASPLPDDDLAEVTRQALAATDEAILAQAEEMLAATDLIDRINADIEAAGVAGEEDLRLTLYLIGTSRLLPRPLAGIVQGQSSSGKSYTIDRVASMFPKEAVIHATQMTPQALFHARQGSLSHRWVVAGERSRIDHDERAEATRALREMLAGGRLSKMMPVKVGGEIRTVMIEQPGPIAFVESTTASRIFEEDANRCILLSTDERRRQTQTILRKLALVVSGRIRGHGGDVLARHHALQRLLQRREIVIPFAEKIATAMNPFADRCQIRRAYPMVLSFIQASALLYQRQRQSDSEGRLIATPIDYQVAVRLLRTPLESMIGGSLSGPAKRFLDRVLEAINATENTLPVPFTTLQVCNHIPTFARSTVGNYVTELEDKGYLELGESPSRQHGRPPKTYQPTYRDTSADTILPSLEQLFGDMGAGEEELPISLRTP